MSNVKQPQRKQSKNFLPSKEDRRRYLILRRKTRKVYPYAKMASERLTSMNERLATIEKKSDRRKYTRRIQKYIEEEFSEKLFICPSLIQLAQSIQKICCLSS